MLNPMTRWTLLIWLCLTLPACSWFKDKPPEYIDAPEAPPLQVPEDLDPPRYITPIVIMAPEMRTPSGDELNPAPPRVANTGGGGDSNAWMAWSAQGVYLLVRDTPESVSRRLRFAIERSGMDMMERGENGDYRFDYMHLQYDDRSFWKKLKFWDNSLGPNYSGVYRTRVEADAEGARIYLYFDSGESATTSAAEHVLGIFMDRLG